MFSKILIANRGEIACRVIRTCRLMGIATVAVYSDADARSLYVREADEAVHIGAAAAAESYLVIEKIIDACKKTGAEAVHPGYGFLSENAAFAEALDAAGIAFIGPPIGAIQAMGDKIESKKLAQAAGVSTVPGHPNAISDPDFAVQIADEIGYPVMVKASAGGGGKGMRIAWNAEEVREGLERSRAEAASSFGDDRCFIEKFIVDPRHIEIQVLGDKHGNIVHLFERECSIQRRHQKVIEEAPSPFLDQDTRDAMGAQAIALARAVDYCSAGTVEFIVDKDRNFYFLEMNTRLQVEHPVTEMITGVDLVEQMIRVAYGEHLSLTQEDLEITGWAMEARVYAEDPSKGFLPSIGRLVNYRPPEGEGIRVDSGVYEGGEVSMYYDPMISKLCAYGDHRLEAIQRLRNALDAYAIRGLGHNVVFLGALLGHSRFIEGRLTTGFIAEEYGERFEGVQPRADECRGLGLIALAMNARMRRLAGTVSGQQEGWQYKLREEWVVTIDGMPIEISGTAFDEWLDLTIDEVTHSVHVDWNPGDLIAHCEIDGDAFIVQSDPIPEGYILTHKGMQVRAIVRTKRAHELSLLLPEKVVADTSGQILAPMPGAIVDVMVKVGDHVKLGQPVVILEAMKMQNVLTAEAEGLLKACHVAKGDTVAADELMLEIEPGASKD